MPSANVHPETVRPLEVLGIGAEEERVYRSLLSKGTATADEVAHELGLPLRKVQRLLDGIESKGLTTHSPERPPRYIPASPDIAMQALALHLQQSMQRAQGAIQDLQKLAAVGREGKQEQIIELITSRDAGKLLFDQILGSAQGEIDVFVRPPVLYTPLESPTSHEGQSAVQARGVRFRSINDAEILKIPGVLEHIRADVAAGEEARVVPSLPFKMVLVDRRVALIFLNPDQANNPLLLVRYSGLLEAFYTLFEILWDKAAPITFSSAGNPRIGEPADGFTPELEQLLPLLAVGLNDKSIAHQLDVSERTVARRVVELLEFLGARTRFQAGWDAAMRSKSVSTARDRSGFRTRR
jgi:predicted DNA-binding transcriptional regulator